MKRSVSALTLLIAAACGREPPPPVRNFDPGPVPAEFAEGEQLFNANCASCHGALAAGTAQGPPLVHIIYEPGHHSDMAFQRAVAMGVTPHHWDFGPMAPVPGVTEEQVASITAYVRWLQRSGGIQ